METNPSKIPKPESRVLTSGQEEDRQRKISIWIDNYDDIFSDFDPRPFSERNISDDFLYEIRRVSNESDFHVGELKLLVPSGMRNPETESLITRRLHSFFRKKQAHAEERIFREKRKGVLLALTGSLLLIGAGYISFLQSGSFLLRAVIILFEPAGWFLAWTGFDSLMNATRQRNAELLFYEKMGRSKILFVSI